MGCAWRLRWVCEKWWHFVTTFFVCVASALRCFASALSFASAVLEKKKAYIHLSLVYGVSRDSLRQSESTMPYPGAPSLRKNDFFRSRSIKQQCPSLTYPASTMDGAARSSSDARKKQRREPSRQRTLDSYAPSCPSELAYAKDASA